MRLKDKHRWGFIFLILLGVTLNACYKEIDEFIPRLIIAPGDYKEVLKAVQEDPEVTTILNEEFSVIQLENASIFIPAQAFEYKDGNAVEGEILIEASEHYVSKDILKYDLPTITGEGELLESDGVFYINAFKDGEQLKIVDGASIHFRVPFEEATEDSELFMINNDVETGLSSWDIVTGDSALQVAQWIDPNSQEFVFGYIFLAKDLDWFNIDKFVDYPDLTNLCIDLPESNTSDNTRVFILFDDLNSIIPCYSILENPDFCSYSAGVPLEFEITVLAIAHREEDHYEAATKRAIVQPNMIIELTPNKVSREELLALIDGL